MEVILNTKRLILRPWQEGDLDSLYEMAKDPEVGPDCGWQPHKDKEESKYVLTRLLMNQYTWAIVLKDSGEVIGDISLMPFGTSNHAQSENEKEIGFWLGRAYWGNGYMPEACKELMRYGFEEKNADCIWCAHHDQNDKSARVQAKCGFRFHHRKEHVHLRQLDCYRNAVVNRITKEEWTQDNQ